MTKPKKKKMTEPVTAPHPMQPLVISGRSIVRFKANAIVQYLLDNGGIDLNRLAVLEFPAEDREQFAQLIGYSVSGYNELSYVTDASAAQANAAAEVLLPNSAGCRAAGCPIHSEAARAKP